MPYIPTYLATVCPACARSTLQPCEPDRTLRCPRCGTRSVIVPGAEYTPADVMLFSQLEGLVHAARLATSEVILLAAELESVATRWEPPDLVLKRIEPRLAGLARVCGPERGYPHLLLAVSMLLTILCARLQDPTRSPRGRTRESGVHTTFSEEPLGKSSTRSLKKIG